MEYFLPQCQKCQMPLQAFNDFLTLSSRLVLLPDGFVHLLFVLLLTCFLSFGSYFCFDNPGALQVLVFIVHFQNIT